MGVGAGVHAQAKPATTLPLLDAHEGCGPADQLPYEFERGVAEVTLEDGETVRAWIYWYRRPVDPRSRIPSGDWLAH